MSQGHVSPSSRVFACLVALVVLLPAGVAQAQTGFACTEVLGFSQSFQWYLGRAGANDGGATGGGRGGRMAGPPGDFLPGWQGRFSPGAAVERWANPAYQGWTGASVSESLCNRSTVDRVLFQVSGAARPLEQWESDIRAVLSLLPQKYPALRQVLLMPVVGGPDGQCTNVRAASNYPTIVEAIGRVADGDKVRIGAAPVVADCTGFVDGVGHLSSEAAAAVKRTLQDYYGDE